MNITPLAIVIICVASWIGAFLFILALCKAAAMGDEWRVK
jgi:hypothetical protein